MIVIFTRHKWKDILTVAAILAGVIFIPRQIASVKAQADTPECQAAISLVDEALTDAMELFSTADSMPGLCTTGESGLDVDACLDGLTSLADVLVEALDTCTVMEYTTMYARSARIRAEATTASAHTGNLRCGEEVQAGEAIEGEFVLGSDLWSPIERGGFVHASLLSEGRPTCVQAQAQSSTTTSTTETPVNTVPPEGAQKLGNYSDNSADRCYWGAVGWGADQNDPDTFVKYVPNCRGGGRVYYDPYGGGGQLVGYERYGNEWFIVWTRR